MRNSNINNALVPPFTGRENRRDINALWLQNIDLANALTAAIGCQFGEVLYIQDVGLKEFGKVYIDANNGQLYRCLNNTTAVSNTMSDFELIGIQASSDRIDAITSLGNVYEYRYLYILDWAAGESVKTIDMILPSTPNDRYMYMLTSTIENDNLSANVLFNAYATAKDSDRYSIEIRPYLNGQPYIPKKSTMKTALLILVSTTQPEDINNKPNEPATMIAGDNGEYYMLNTLAWRAGESVKTFKVNVPSLPSNGQVSCFVSSISTDGASGHCYFKVNTSRNSDHDYSVTVTPYLNGEQYTTSKFAMRASVFVDVVGDSKEDRYGGRIIKDLTWGIGESTKTVDITFNSAPKNGNVLCFWNLLNGDGQAGYCYFKITPKLVSGNTYRLTITPYLNGQQYTTTKNTMKIKILAISDK